MKRLIIILAVLLLTLITAVTAFADPPYTFSETVDSEGPFINCSYYGFGDFEIWQRYVAEVRHSLFYNQEGFVVRDTSNSHGTISFYAPYNPEKAISGHVAGRLEILWDRELGKIEHIRMSGNGWSIQLPHEGNVYHIAGTSTLDDTLAEIKVAGLIVEDYVALCEYFAP
jgi:hypothetical protein